MAAPADSRTFEGDDLETCQAALNHCVIDVVEHRIGDFLSLICGAGFDFFTVAFVVESDYLHWEVFEFAIGVERAAEVVANVGHDFWSLRGFNQIYLLFSSVDKDAIFAGAKYQMRYEAMQQMVQGRRVSKSPQTA